MSAPFTWRRNGRRPLTLAVVLGVWALLVAAWLLLDAAPWIVATLALFTLPAARDYARDATARMRLDDTVLHWSSGARDGEVALARVDHVRLDTRLDFSVRATVVLDTGRRIRLPFEATPPHRAFEDALAARGVAVRRFHFQLAQ